MRLHRRNHNSSRFAQGFIHRTRIIGSVCSEPCDGAFNVLKYRDANGRIGNDSISDCRGDDVATPVNGQMQFAPATTAACSVLVSLPFSVTKYLQTGRVYDEVERSSMILGEVRDLHATMTS